MPELDRGAILAMKPGLNLDALVAEKVMGYKVLRDRDGFAVVDTDDEGPFPATRFLPPVVHYSGIGGHVFKVLGRMRELGWCPWLEIDNGGWDCGMGHEDGRQAYMTVDDVEEIPAAWCKAALLAVLNTERQSEVTQGDDTPHE